MKSVLFYLVEIFSLLTILIGMLGLGVSLPTAYLLWAGQIEQGQPYFVDGLAPTKGQSLLECLAFIGLMAFGALLRVVVKRFKASAA